MRLVVLALLVLADALSVHPQGSNVTMIQTNATTWSLLHPDATTLHLALSMAPTLP